MATNLSPTIATYFPGYFSDVPVSVLIVRIKIRIDTKIPIDRFSDSRCLRGDKSLDLIIKNIRKFYMRVVSFDNII